MRGHRVCGLDLPTSHSLPSGGRPLPEASLSDPWLTDWLHLLARWFHLIVGAAWIGTSFYFNWLNNNVRPVAVKDNPDGRLAGALWSV
ncbi:MAG: urate hydroxylase PuuD, partial [Myxococcota bacterium]|nr:urate hydroxylase PuuD [Myxococcota bacterium]